MKSLVVPNWIKSRSTLTETPWELPYLLALQQSWPERDMMEYLREREANREYHEQQQKMVDEVRAGTYIQRY